MIALFLAFHVQTSIVFSPKTIALNDGWKFTNLPNPPSIWSGADAIPTSQWKVIRVSSQEAVGENAVASRAFDGDPKTFWHTQWQGRQAPYPHELVIDLGVRTGVRCRMEMLQPHFFFPIGTLYSSTFK